MFIIILTPTVKGSQPHIWVEGGQFFSKKAAEFQAGQIRKMSDRYANAEVVKDAGGKKFALAKAVFERSKATERRTFKKIYESANS